MFGKDERILVALSGGADSVALLRVLLANGYVCEAAHCNFHLRGDESVRDENFVRQLTEQLGVPLHVTHFNTTEYASQQGVSIEMAARELRYGWFEEVRQRIGASVIAVAHHRDDSVETFLLNLTRGTGIDGLRGIRPKNGAIVRPLLGVSREEILTYLSALNQPYVTDSTNLEDDFTRNKLRLNVLPMLESINPSVKETIAETARRLSEVADVYHAAMAEACNRVRTGERRVNISALLRETAPQAVLYELFHPLGFNASQLKDIYAACVKGQSGKLFYAAGYVLLCDRSELVWKQRNEGEDSRPVLHQEIVDRQTADRFLRNPDYACLDADRVSQPLTLRKWQSGDRFIPYGMKGFKKVRNYMLDKKFSVFRKAEQYVVCSGGEIVWLVGERTDNRYCVTPETRRILLLHVGFMTKPSQMY